MNVIIQFLVGNYISALVIFRLNYRSIVKILPFASLRIEYDIF